MSAAQHADVLFVKLKENGESDLANYCRALGIKHVLFQTFEQVIPLVKAVVEGRVSVKEAVEVGTVIPTDS
ncbi:hypothetical protein FRC16_007449, partial [Serendipita sp. 398]